VATLVDNPKGQVGRPSRSFTLEQSLALLEAARESRLNAYVVLSLATGIRTEEARELHWDHVGLVFASAIGTPLDAANVRREFRQITEAAGLGLGWAPRDLRHTFVYQFRRRRPHRGDRPPGRPQPHRHHRTRLPPRTAPCHHHRRRSNGPDPELA
jgi:site-specific recombinase XerD